MFRYFGDDSAHPLGVLDGWDYRYVHDVCCPDEEVDVLDDPVTFPNRAEEGLLHVHDHQERGISIEEKRMTF